MTNNNYLLEVLADQTLAEDSDEIKALKKRGRDVERLLRKAYGVVPTIQEGGSRAKGTMNRESYDLDVPCYFPHDSTCAGETLKDIFYGVQSCLETEFIVEPKASALRLRSKDAVTHKVDLFTDVVPGRFIDQTATDTNLYQANAEKYCLKTNLQVHVAHVRDSGVLEAIRLMKLWRVRNVVPVRQFILELLTIKLLIDHKQDDLASQLERVWGEFRDHPRSLAVVDPANPYGNDLSGMLDSARWSLCSIADGTLRTLSQSGWETVFPISVSDADRGPGLRQIAGSVSRPIKPWAW